MQLDVSFELPDGPEYQIPGKGPKRASSVKNEILHRSRNVASVDVL